MPTPRYHQLQSSDQANLQQNMFNKGKRDGKIGNQNAKNDNDNESDDGDGIWLDDENGPHFAIPTLALSIFSH